MSEITSGIGKISLTQLRSALVNSVIVSVLAVLYSVSVKEGFDIFSANWPEIGKMVMNAAIAAFVGSIGKTLLTDNTGTTHLGVAKVETQNPPEVK